MRGRASITWEWHGKGIPCRRRGACSLSSSSLCLGSSSWRSALFGAVCATSEEVLVRRRRQRRAAMKRFVWKKRRLEKNVKWDPHLFF